MSNDRHEDKRVSEAYKDLATERTPEQLDKNVLAMAAARASAKKPAYSRWMAWSRPAAWAATITLCLAITLELAQGPAVDVSIEAKSPASAPAADEIKRADMELQQEAAESLAKSAASEKTSLARSASKQTFHAPARAQEAQEAQEAQKISSNALSEDFDADDSPCPAEVRAVASDWLDCILELEAAGLVAMADAERQLLIDTFPDFKFP